MLVYYIFNTNLVPEADDYLVWLNSDFLMISRLQTCWGSQQHMLFSLPYMPDVIKHLIATLEVCTIFYWLTEGISQCAHCFLNTILRLLNINDILLRWIIDCLFIIFKSMALPMSCSAAAEEGIQRISCCRPIHSASDYQASQPLQTLIDYLIKSDLTSCSSTVANECACLCLERGVPPCLLQH